MTVLSESPEQIADNAVLANYCRQWANAPLLALDTEFVRETTFYPIPGLIQLGAGDAQYLLDPLSIDDWSPLRALFAGPIPKVLHSCGEDLEIFQLVLGELPQPLYDTQVGAALAGWGFGLGYQALVSQVLGLQVDKEHTRSNWVARPLTAEQCTYAALDVAHLAELYARISQRLVDLGRIDWWREEGDRALSQSRREVAPDQYYRKLTAGFRLRGRQVLALQQLCVWRESSARRLNTPRGRVLKDAECLEIANRMPSNISELSRLPDLDPRRMRTHADAILGIVQRAEDSPLENCPEPIEPPLPREWGGRLNRLREHVTARATELGLAPELLARKRDCEQVLRTGALPEGLQGWRLAVIGAELVELAKTFT